MREMKYKPEDYIGTGIYMDDEIIKVKEKVVKCRKTHQCGNCQGEIQLGQYALYESAFFDGKPVHCYTCLPCVEEWLEESGQVSEEMEEEQ